MKRLLTIMLLLTVAAFAKDKSYTSGTLERYAGATGTYTDSSRCFNSASGWTCGSGFQADYATAYFLTLRDGQRVSLRHAPMRSDVLKHFDLSNGPVAVSYRVDHPHMGQTFIVLVDPSGKEGTYYTEDKFDWKAAR